MRIQPERFAENQPAPEGPVVGPSGWILNVCSLTQAEHGLAFRGGDISATHTAEPLVTHRILNTSTDAVTGIPASLAFGPDGALYITDEGRRSIVRVAPDGGVSDFIQEFEGQPLNGPNDLSFDGAGNLFFTDPWGSGPDNPIGSVFGYDWQTGNLHRIATGMRFPNGIIVRESRLYVAETFLNRIWVWDVTGPGQATGKEEFAVCPEVPGAELVGPDGMCFDRSGNLYVAHIGTGAIVVLDQLGTEIERIPTGGVKTTNVCFGGPDHDELFVTQENLGAVLRFRLGVPGDRLQFCPSRVEDHPWLTLLPSRRPIDSERRSDL
jgi:gluconolactonase